MRWQQSGVAASEVAALLWRHLRWRHSEVAVFWGGDIYKFVEHPVATFEKVAAQIQMSTPRFKCRQMSLIFVNRQDPAPSPRPSLATNAL